jgi:predicted lipoprotein
MKKEIKYLMYVVLTGIVIYTSVYFRPLDEKLAESHVIEFDANSFVAGIWKDDLVKVFDEAIDIRRLISKLQNEPEKTFNEEAHSLGIGNIGYFKISGTGTVLEVNENNVMLQVGDLLVELETEFIFGNAIRDASGLIRINDYNETSEFNSISESINDRIRSEVIPGFRASVEKGDEVFFKGAIELNKAHLDLTRPEVIPISIQIIQ